MGTYGFHFDNSYARELEGFFAPWQAATVPSPHILLFNHALASQLGLNGAALDSDAGAAIFSGNEIPEGVQPLAQAYAGHQFGNLSPQLGDGRALLLGELLDPDGRRWDIQLKGSGRTPFSRGGDGKAALGPVLREYLMGEAMTALGIPTTRALAAVSTGEIIHRDTPLPGAILTRIAASHIRVGTFQFFAIRNDQEKVRQLADYTIARHYPALKTVKNPYLALFNAVADQQAALIARWMLAGFIHGVMNTDNMSIAGETIDYGPCAFMDRYDPATVFSSIDSQGRYAYGNQPLIAQWNLTRFAETLVELVDSDNEAAIRQLTEAINHFPKVYADYWLQGMRAKLGLHTEEEQDQELAQDFLMTLEGQSVDYTRAFRSLSAVALGNPAALRSQFDDAETVDAWLQRWQDRLTRQPVQAEEMARHMDRVNPIYIPRNHKVEEALDAATQNRDLSLFRQLLEVLAEPFTERPGLESYAQPAPESFGVYKTFCGT
jgi:Uncharacterized conserved protein